MISSISIHPDDVVEPIRVSTPPTTPKKVEEADQSPIPMRPVGREGQGHMPYFIFTITFLQCVMFLATLYIDSFGDTPHPLHEQGIRPFTAIHMGGRFVPCMRPHVLSTPTIRLDTSEKRYTLEEVCGATWALPYQAWRFITPVLLHLTVGHLLANLMVQLLVGAFLEWNYGMRRVMAVYFTACFGSQLPSAFLEPELLLSFGASGSIFGLAGAMIVDGWIRWESLWRPMLRTCLLCLITTAILVLSFGIGVDGLGHAVGLLVGVWASSSILPRKRAWSSDSQWPKLRISLGVSLAATLGVILILFYATPALGWKKCRVCRTIIGFNDPEPSAGKFWEW